MKKTEKKIGQIFKDKGLITQEQLNLAIKRQEETGKFLGEVLIDAGFINSADLLKVLSERFGIPIVYLKNKYIDYKLVENFPLSAIFDSKCLPFEEDGQNIWVAVVNPLDAEAISRIQKLSGGKRVQLRLTLREDMEQALGRCKIYFNEKIKKLLE